MVWIFICFWMFGYCGFSSLVMNFSKFSIVPNVWFVLISLFSQAITSWTRFSVWFRSLRLPCELVRNFWSSGFSFAQSMISDVFWASISGLRIS